MDIIGLENNYYLSGNDIWIKVQNFPKIPVKLELQVTNTNTSKTTSILRIYPDLSNVFEFNLSQAIRPLQPNPDHTDINTLQNYEMVFTVIYDDETSDAETVDKYFIRGGRYKNNVDEWHLENGAKLIISKWVEWGVPLPGFANKIQDQLILDYVPTASETYRMFLKTCNYKIIKFLNSLGGYQFWIFESNEEEIKAKPLDEVSITPSRLRDNIYRNIGSENTREITLKSKTPIDLQPIIMNLIGSNDILMYDPAGTDNESRWTRIILSGSPEAIINTTDRVYTNEIKFKLPTFNRFL